MVKKPKSTYDEFIESLSPSDLEDFQQGLREFALSELLLAIMEEDHISVRQLAEIAGVSPTVVQSMRSGVKKDYSLQTFFKVLKGLGCKKLILEFKNQSLPLDITVKKNS